MYYKQKRRWWVRPINQKRNEQGWQSFNRRNETS